MDAFPDPGAMLAASGARAFVAKEKLVDADLLCLFGPQVPEPGPCPAMRWRLDGRLTDSCKPHKSLWPSVPT
jgi:hypothetical protein